MASLNPPIADDLSQLALPRHAVIVGFSAGSGGREVLLARRDGMHLDVRKLADLFNFQFTTFTHRLFAKPLAVGTASASSQAPNARCCPRKVKITVNQGYIDTCLGMATAVGLSVGRVEVGVV